MADTVITIFFLFCVPASFFVFCMLVLYAFGSLCETILKRKEKR